MGLSYGFLARVHIGWMLLVLLLVSAPVLWLAPAVTGVPGVIALVVLAVLAVVLMRVRAARTEMRLLRAGGDTSGGELLSAMMLALSKVLPRGVAAVGLRHEPREELEWLMIRRAKGIEPISAQALESVLDDRAGAVSVRAGAGLSLPLGSGARPLRIDGVCACCYPLQSHPCGVWLVLASEAGLPDMASAQRYLNVLAPRVRAAVAGLQSARDLARREARLAHLVEHAQHLLWCLDEQGRWSFVNDAVAAAYGLDPGLLIGRSFTDFSASSEARRDREMLHNVLAGEVVEDYQTRHRRADGRELILEIRATPMHDADGGTIGVVGSASDVTDREHERVEREYNSGMFAGILARMPVVFFRVDTEKRFTDVRGHGLERLDAADGEWVGRDARWLFRNADARIDAALAGGTDVFETGGSDASGPWWLLNHLTFDAWHGQGAIGFGIDVTEARLARDESDRLAQENKHLARRLLEVQEAERRHIARELHDDMGQSLTAIKTVSVALANMQQPQPDEVRRLGGSITRIAGELYELVHRRMRQLRPGLLDSLGLTEALKACIYDSRIEQTGVNCRLSLHGDLDNMNELVNITVYRVVQECLTNIAKYAMASDVEVLLNRQDLDSGGSRLTLMVRDDGVGLTDGPGEGMGLQGMRERVSALGGRLSVASEPGKGVQVRLELDFAESEQFDVVEQDT